MSAIELRRMDDLGRVQIPKLIRRELRLHYGDEFEFEIVNGGVLVKKKEIEEICK